MQSVEKSNTIFAAYPEKIDIPGVVGENGAVHFCENKSLFPKGIQRCFWITGVSEGCSRGNHAHWKEAQVIVAVAGSVVVKICSVDGKEHRFLLTHPAEGIHVPPLNWVEVTWISVSTVLVLSDHEFAEEDFIRDKSYFEGLKKDV